MPPLQEIRKFVFFPSQLWHSHFSRFVGRRAGEKKKEEVLEIRTGKAKPGQQKTENGEDKLCST